MVKSCAAFNCTNRFQKGTNVTFHRILGKEGIFDQFRRMQFYEKPFQVRRRVNYERCKGIYNEDMGRKIQFIMRKNRTEPFPGCY